MSCTCFLQILFLFFQNQILKLDIQTTGFIVISKSGTTPETISQLGSLINIANQIILQQADPLT